MTKVTENFKQAMAAAGIVINESIVADSQGHRFRVEGDSSGSKNGYYKLHGDQVPAGSFGCWKRDVHETWCSKSWQGLSPMERDQVKKRFQEAKILREKEQAKIHAETRERAVKIWETASEVQSHLYLKNKGVNGYGIRENRGSLIVPVRNSEGDLTSLQFIRPDGTKRFLPGGKIKGCYHLIEKPEKILYITEGYATGATIHQATGEAVALAFNAGNLKVVAESLRQKYGNISIVIVADDDAFTDGNPGLTKANEAALAVGGKVALPMFDDVSSKPTDFNDLFQLEGAERVRELLTEASDPSLPLAVVLGKLAGPLAYRI